MGYGIRLKNTDGVVIINEKYGNYMKHAEGEDTFTNTLTKTIDNTIIPPVILIQPSSDHPCALASVHKTDSNYDGFFIRTYLNKQITIKWKVYIPHKGVSGEDYGLRIKDDLGNLVFDSGHSYFKIREVHNVTFDSEAHYIDISHPNYSNPYYILNAGLVGIQWLAGYPSGTVYYMRVGIQKLSSTSVRLATFIVFKGNGGSQPTQTLYFGNFNAKLVVCET